MSYSLWSLCCKVIQTLHWQLGNIKKNCVTLEVLSCTLGHEGKDGLVGGGGWTWSIDSFHKGKKKKNHPPVRTALLYWKICYLLDIYHCCCPIWVIFDQSGLRSQSYCWSHFNIVRSVLKMYLSGPPAWQIVNAHSTDCIVKMVIEEHRFIWPKVHKRAHTQTHTHVLLPHVTAACGWTFRLQDGIQCAFGIVDPIW